MKWATQNTRMLTEGKIYLGCVSDEINVKFLALDLNWNHWEVSLEKKMAHSYISSKWSLSHVQFYKTCML